MVGQLPSDFLRVSASPQQQQIHADQQTAALLQAQQPGYSFVSPNMARLSVTIAQVYFISFMCYTTVPCQLCCPCYGIPVSTYAVSLYRQS